MTLSLWPQPKQVETENKATKYERTIELSSATNLSSMSDSMVPTSEPCNSSMTNLHQVNRYAGLTTQPPDPDAAEVSSALLRTSLAQRSPQALHNVLGP